MKVRITRVGQPCRRCGEKVIKKTPNAKLREGQEYYYKWYLYCPKCRNMYMVETAKVYLTASVIPYKPTPSEFEIQSFVYEVLKKKGINIRGNVPNGRKNGNPNFVKMYFDLVVYSKDNVAEKIIEIKDSENHNLDTKQHNKYKTVGLPVIYVRGMREARRFVNEYGE